MAFFEGLRMHSQIHLQTSLITGAVQAGAVASPLLSPEWCRLLQRVHPNVLLAGTRVAVNLALDALQSSLQQPIVTWRADGPLAVASLPSSGTLVFPAVDGLSRENQQGLLSWLDAMGKVQVVSTTRVPLFRLVERGVFLDTLYYRLNVVYLEVAVRQFGR